MSVLLAAVVATAASAPATPATPAAALSVEVRRMVEAAANSGDQAKINAVVSVAKQTNPQAAAEIDTIVARIAAAQENARQARLHEASYFDNWKGSGQLGGAISTGNSRARSLTAGLSLEKTGIRWRHRVNALLDLVNGDDDTDQERILAGYQLDYQFSDRFYSWARLEYERNQRAGINRRFAESAGFGWQVIVPGPVRWDLELGPAVRQTRYESYAENRIAARGASRFSWNLSKAMTFTNDSALFWERAASISNTAALSSKVFGAVSARLSYSIVWEEQPPIGLENLDTTSRITLVYDF